MSADIFRFEGNEFMLWRWTNLYQSICRIPEHYGVIPDHGRGIDAYRAMSISLVIENGQLFLDEIQITAIGDCYFPIADRLPEFPRGRLRGANYRDLRMPVAKSGVLILLKDRVRWVKCVSGWFSPSDFSDVRELEFVAGRMLESAEDSDLIQNERNSLAESHLAAIDQSLWIDLEKWMSDSFTDERPPGYMAELIATFKSGGSVLECAARFPDVVKPVWSEQQIALVSCAAVGNICHQDAFELQLLFEKAIEQKLDEAKDDDLHELMMCRKGYWKSVEEWMLSDPSLSEILCVRHNMSLRSMYAKQDEQEETGSGAAQHPEGTH